VSTGKKLLELLAKRPGRSNDYTAFKQFSAVDIGEILTEARSDTRVPEGMEACEQATEAVTMAIKTVCSCPKAERASHRDVIIEQVSGSIYLGVEGLGEPQAYPGQGRPVMLEVWDGEIRLIVWADINSDDPTHIIPLTKAAETNRQDSDDGKEETGNDPADR